NLDIVMGGNFYESKPEVGIYDASYGVFLKGDGKGGFKSVKMEHSGFKVRGAIRGIKTIRAGKFTLMLAALNNSKVKVFKIK
ncbi:hypothetical protein, partial [Segetibacter sp.]|uniref:hypothetical protein n=1 Tax=Segetibacter sp. TaxID=2231182 RepID=UPI0026359BB2